MQVDGTCDESDCKEILPQLDGAMDLIDGEGQEEDTQGGEDQGQGQEEAMENPQGEQEPLGETEAAESAGDQPVSQEAGKSFVVYCCLSIITSSDILEKSFMLL